MNNFHKALADIQRGFSTLLQNLTHPHPSLHKPSPPWARIAQTAGARPMSVEAIEERLEGIPVYALSNASDEFLLVSGASTSKNLGLFCFNKDDAEALLQQVTLIDPQARQGSKVVPVALNKVFQLKVNGVAFRLIPEFSQVKNALRERENSGLPSSGFSGVPVFQSRSLLLKNQDKRYRPLFFRKQEDLENTLQLTAREQNKLNPAFRQGDIQVATLEDVIKEMKESSTSNWDDVIFIPPGFDVSADANQQ
ncbi:protein TIC 22-like, chloroplastic isoform X2 [Abrus precatorius]|uniref:Protein TIC 22-like, chloroplastic isoform X2 n=1 Tax=Abrus precatorius TaxID=3816 RepID=A0A8B8KCP1_ABRPR|nr:protein TIC 22-like, chloroplastic isoform X2 [Abrus precatorius]